MLKVSNSSLITIVTKILILLVVAKSISLGVWWYLPSDGVELNVKNNYQPKYQRVSFNNMIELAKKEIELKPEEVQEVKTSVSITNMVLKGLYGTKTKGFIIVAMKSSPKKTSIIGIGEVFQGYTLKSIIPDGAILLKAGTEYILSLEKLKDNGSVTKEKKTKVKTRSSVPSKPQRPTGVSRKDINFYAKNPKQIWKDISISEVKDGKKIKGFKVNRINRKSKFAALGLEKGDIIVKANNVQLKSYRDAINIYKSIDKLDTIQIVVLRNNQEKELVYEID